MILALLACGGAGSPESATPSPCAEVDAIIAGPEGAAHDPLVPYPEGGDLLLTHGADGGWLFAVGVNIAAPAGTEGETWVMVTTAGGIAIASAASVSPTTAVDGEACVSRMSTHAVLPWVGPDEPYPPETLACTDVLLRVGHVLDGELVGVTRTYPLRVVLDPLDRADPDDPCRYVLE